MKHNGIMDNLSISNTSAGMLRLHTFFRFSHLALRFFLGTFVLLGIALQAAVPGMIHYQGRISVNGAPFSGTGFFKFAIVSAEGDITYWSNDGSSGQGSEPTSPVSLPVVEGLYALALGDTTLDGMSHSITPDVFSENENIWLRVWFDDGLNGSQ